MSTNIDKYKNDLKKLIAKGGNLSNAMQYECFREEFFEAMTKKIKDPDKQNEFLKSIPNFKNEYQKWYSESLALVKQLMPDRLLDFIRYYERPKTRKDITNSNYVIEDYLQGLSVTRGYEKVVVVGPNAAIPVFAQQLNIVMAVEQRFESSLFDIKQLVQADLFDSELEAAKELIKHKFARAGGALAGVVLEKHLNQVLQNHNLTTAKKNLTLNDYSELLKNNNVIDLPQWRFIQHLADIRNICDHGKAKDPTVAEVEDLISGVEKIVKTVF